MCDVVALLNALRGVESVVMRLCSELWRDLRKNYATPFELLMEEVNQSIEGERSELARLEWMKPLMR